MTKDSSLSLVAPKNGVATTTSLVIADGTLNQHSSILRLLRDNITDFEEFGRVSFEIEPFETAGGTQKRTVAVLNREHAMLLLTYMRNNTIVKEFKKRLIHAFVAIEAELNARPVFDPSTLSRADILRMALNAEEERQALEVRNKQLEPKADAFEAFMDASGKYSVGVVAKMLGVGQNKLFRELRNHGVLIAKGSMRNTPYAQYMHHFEVLAHEFQRRDGSQGVSYTTYVQPSGVDFIRRRLGLTGCGSAGACELSA